eukprot:2879920-Prymnesium_polylepis.1
MPALNALSLRALHGAMSVAAALDQTFEREISASRDQQCPHGSMDTFDREESGLKLVHGLACSGRT